MYKVSVSTQPIIKTFGLKTPNVAITGPPGSWHGIVETMTFREQYKHETRVAVGGSEFMALLGGWLLRYPIDEAGKARMPKGDFCTGPTRA